MLRKEVKVAAEVVEEEILTIAQDEIADAEDTEEVIVAEAGMAITEEEMEEAMAETEITEETIDVMSTEFSNIFAKNFLQEFLSLYRKPFMRNICIEIVVS